MSTHKPRNTFIDGLISRMTLDQKIGAVLTLAFTGITPGQNVYDYITKYHCGGLRLTPVAKAGTTIQYVDPKTGTTETRASGHTMAPVCTATDYKATLDKLRKVAKARPLGLPLHFSFDQEGGVGNLYFANSYPCPMGIRATNDPKMAYLVAKAVADQGRAIGVNWIHSPDVDINCDPRNPEIGIRSYSNKAEEVAQYSIEACKGFKEGGMIATAKHFPGRGASIVDAHYEVPTIDADRETLYAREILPYKELIDQDLLPAVMIAHTIYPALDPDNVATVSKPIITGILREELGFEGVVTTDSMTMGGIAKRYGVAQACAMALEAGADLVLMKAQNHLVEDTIAAIRSFIEEGRITMEEMDKKIYRILNLKYEYGLFHDYAQDDVDPMAVINSSRLVELSKDAAKRSIILARNQDDMLPLKAEEKVLVVEQRNSFYNAPIIHSGILFESCLNYSSNVTYMEVGHIWSEEEKASIKASLSCYDKIVITSYYSREALGNKEALAELLENTDAKVIVISSTPYEELSIPRSAKNVIVTFGGNIVQAETLAGILYGKINAEGIWPVDDHA